MGITGWMSSGVAACNVITTYMSSWKSTKERDLVKEGDFTKPFSDKLISVKSRIQRGHTFLGPKRALFVAKLDYEGT